MRSPLIIGDGVDLVDDDAASPAKYVAALFGRQQDEQGLGRCDQNVGWVGEHLLPFPGSGVTRPYGGANGRERNPFFGGELIDLGQRRFEVLSDVVAEGLQRRDVYRGRLVGEGSGPGSAQQLVETDQERGQGLS